MDENRQTWEDEERNIGEGKSNYENRKREELERYREEKRKERMIYATKFNVFLTKCFVGRLYAGKINVQRLRVGQWTLFLRLV